VAAVVVDDHAAVTQPARGAGWAGQQRGLGADLGLQRARRERARLHDAGESRLAGGRVEQVMAREPVLADPAAPADAARGRRRVRDTEAVQRRAVERALDLQLALDRRGAADREVAGAADREGRVLGQLGREQVREQPLGEPAAVDRDARRARDGACSLVDLDPSPELVRAACGGVARGRERQHLTQRRGGGEVMRVAQALELAEQRAVDEPGCHRAGLAHRERELGHHVADGHGRARIAVQPRDLAGGKEAREALVPLEQRVPRALGGGAVTGDEHEAAAAEAVEAQNLLARAHDWEVVSVVGSSSVLASLLDEEDFEGEGFSLRSSSVERDVSSLVFSVLVETCACSRCEAVRCSAVATSAGSCPEASCT
jgi:hypothetical protein